MFMLWHLRQGETLPAYFFAVYIDVIRNVSLLSGCRPCLCQYLAITRDDILLLAPSLSSLQKLLFKLRLLDLAMNTKKSVCTRYDSR